MFAVRALRLPTPRFECSIFFTLLLGCYFFESPLSIPLVCRKTFKRPTTEEHF